jgi:hypothetical protein
MPVTGIKSLTQWWKKLNGQVAIDWAWIAVIITTQRTHQGTEGLIEQ